MAVSTRLKGNGGLFFSLKRGASSAVVFDDVKNWALDWEDKDASDLTFSEAKALVASGGKVPVLNFTAIASFDSTSLFKYLWDNAGATDLLVTVGPEGNTTASVNDPHLQFTATAPQKPGISNESKTDETGSDFEFTLNGSTDVTWKTS